MGLNRKKILIFWIFYPTLISSISIDSLYLDLIQQNLSDFKSFDNFYRQLLKEVRHHRVIDTVSSPINITIIQSNTYDEDYLKNSCYETASDLLSAHGYNKTDLKLSTNDIQSLLPAILNTVENPGCQRKLPPVKTHRSLHDWIAGLISVVILKTLQIIIFFISGRHSSALTSSGISDNPENSQNSPDEISFSPTKRHLWFGLGFNAFTCGIILGATIYHIIPHIYEIPDEDFSYTYLLRGTVILCGIFLFFIVEKLLRFRFKVDEMQFDESNNNQDEITAQSDSSMIQMAKMHGTFHVQESDHSHHKHPDSPMRLPSNVDSDNEETNLKVEIDDVKHEKHSAHHNLKRQTRNLILYQVIYDFSNDIIYGCGLSTAIAHNPMIAWILRIMIISEGSRRHSHALSSLGRRFGFVLLFLSSIFLIIGYVLGGILIQINLNIIITHKEYIYSIVYGALFYTALVTLIPELNDFGQHIQTASKTANQTSKQRRLVKALILICQILFLVIGVLIALLFAIIWRYNHRKIISKYVCSRDSSRLFCH